MRDQSKKIERDTADRRFADPDERHPERRQPKRLHRGGHLRWSVRTHRRPRRKSALGPARPSFRPDERRWRADARGDDARRVAHVLRRLAPPRRLGVAPDRPRRRARVERERQRTRRSSLALASASGDVPGAGGEEGGKSSRATADALGGKRVTGARVPSPRRDPRLATHPGKVKVALCQLSVGDDKFQETSTPWSRRCAPPRGTAAALVVLPGMWNCPYANASFPTHAEGDEPDFDFELGPLELSRDGRVRERGRPTRSPRSQLRRVARETGVVLVGGSIPERDGEDPSLLYNACCVFDGDRGLVARHRKTHLFDLDIPGKISFKVRHALRGRRAHRRGHRDRSNRRRRVLRHALPGTRGGVRQPRCVDARLPRRVQHHVGTAALGVITGGARRR